ncbi:ero1-like protein [Topomyia yanbarensis]|uniref:ero1-like protein n=1 Tax=Topomyia yanbarensis TaxID=2498891 RepID=UPI00273A7EF4|nr:ero1-like protein [Topomyia yanbarensis]
MNEAATTMSVSMTPCRRRSSGHLHRFQWFFVSFVALIVIVNNSSGYFYKDGGDQAEDRFCFCQLQGTIDDCSCNVDTVDYYNNVKIYPRLRSLLVKDFFRYYKVNLVKECPFWVDDSKCAMRYCHVQQCEEKDIPPGLKGDTSSYLKYIKEVQTLTNCDEDLDVELGYLNTSISDKAHKEFKKWADYDQAQDNFCILDDHEPGAEYVDLLLNPERYTGYRGESARRIWSSIYLENCFQSHSIRRSNRYSAMIPYKEMTQSEVCLEHRVFYRMISGLHSSINIHLSAHYLLSEKNSMGFVSPTGIWGPNFEEFERRFSPQTTDNEGSHWLRNLYFAYLVEMRALAKAAPYLRSEEYFTGREREDKEVRIAIKDLLNVIESFPSHFNESVMFSGGTSSVKLKNEFREKFMNISKVMDCVGCDKCRLWGKLQVQGMGTALKILFSGKFDDQIESSIATKLKPENSQFKLKRAEIVALLNAFGRLSTSIHELEEFRQKMR